MRPTTPDRSAEMGLVPGRGYAGAHAVSPRLVGRER